MKPKEKCRFIKESDGERCGNHALRGSKLCFAHYPKTVPTILAVASAAMLFLIDYGGTKALDTAVAKLNPPDRPRISIGLNGIPYQAANWKSVSEPDAFGFTAMVSASNTVKLKRDGKLVVSLKNVGNIPIETPRVTFSVFPNCTVTATHSWVQQGATTVQLLLGWTTNEYKFPRFVASVQNFIYLRNTINFSPLYVVQEKEPLIPASVLVELPSGEQVIVQFQISWED